MTFFKLFVISCAFYTCSNNYEQTANELKIMENNDQKIRSLLRDFDNGQMNGLNRIELIKKMNKIDSLHYLKLNDIFRKYGFIDYNRFGKIASHNFWVLVQHQDKYIHFQLKVLEDMHIAVNNNNASQKDFAYLTDRVQINNGLEQIYGTQMMLNESKTSFIPKPTINFEKINTRRKKIGLKPIDKYIKLMNEEYFGVLKDSI